MLTKSKKKLYTTTVLALSLILGAPLSINAYNVHNYNKNINSGDSYKEKDEFTNSINSYKNASKYKNNEDLINEKIDEVKMLIESKNNYDQAINLFNDNQYIEAINLFKLVLKIDEKRYSLAQEKVTESSANYISQYLDMAETKMNESNFNDAIGHLEKVIEFDKNNSQAQKLKDECNLKIEEKRQAEENAKKLEESKRIAEQQANSNTKANSNSTNTEAVTKPSQVPPKNSKTNSFNSANINLAKDLEEYFNSRYKREGTRTFSGITIHYSIFTNISMNSNFSTIISVDGIDKNEKVPYTVTFYFPSTTLAFQGYATVAGDSKTIPIIEHVQTSAVKVDFDINYKGEKIKITDYPK